MERLLIQLQQFDLGVLSAEVLENILHHAAFFFCLGLAFGFLHSLHAVFLHLLIELRNQLMTLDLGNLDLIPNLESFASVLRHDVCQLLFLLQDSVVISVESALSVWLN